MKSFAPSWSLARLYLIKLLTAVPFRDEAFGVWEIYSSKTNIRIIYFPANQMISLLNRKTYYFWGYMCMFLSLFSIIFQSEFLTHIDITVETGNLRRKADAFSERHFAAMSAINIKSNPSLLRFA